MKEKIKDIWEKCGIYGILMVVQYLAAVVFNFRYTCNAVESDSAKLFRHAVEMSKNHALYIKDWTYTTTMELDSSALLAAPFYSITHDINIAFALSNAVILAFSLYVIIRLLVSFGQNTKTALLACNLFMVPYAFGMLDYFNMLMFGGGQYIFRVLIPMLLLIILNKGKENRLRPECLILAVITLFLILLGSISSGIYILVSCVLPIIICVIYDALISDSFRKYDFFQYATVVVALVTTGIGLVINKGMDAGTIGNTMSLLRWYDLRYYFDCFCEGYFHLFGAMPGAIADESVAVMSARGIAFLIKLLISVLVLVVFAQGCKETIFRKCNLASNKVSGANTDIRFFLCGIAFINFTEIAVCETRYNSLNTTLEYRYLLPFMVPMLLCLAVQLPLWKEKWSKYIKNMSVVLIPMLILFITVIGYVDAHDGLDGFVYCDELTRYVQESGYETAIFMDDRPTAEVCRIKDMDREYEAYASSSGCMDIVDYYEAAWYNDFYTDNNLLFVIQGTDLAGTIGSKADYYSYRDSILWYDVYEASEFVLGM